MSKQKIVKQPLLFFENPKEYNPDTILEQPDYLASLISEATNVAKRIVDMGSFYNSLPQNLRNKYTFKAWCEILEALSTMKGQEQQECIYGWALEDREKYCKYCSALCEARIEQEQPEVDLEKALKGLDNAYFDLDGIAVKGATYYLTVNDLKEIARHFYDLCLNAKKEE